MAKSSICSIGMSFPHDDVTFLDFHSGASLLDADIILFSPSLQYETSSLNPTYQGKPNLSDTSSAQNRDSLKHWRSQLLEAYNSGATILVFLAAPELVFAATGTQDFSGTGRNQKVIRHVGEISSHESLPITFEAITAAKGKKIKLAKDGSILTAFWNALSGITHYECHFQHKSITLLMLTRTGDKCVAARLTGKKGNFFILPVLDFDRDSFSIYDEKKMGWYWSDEAVKFANALVQNVVDLHKAVRGDKERLSLPEWAATSAYKLHDEVQLDKKLKSVEKEIAQLRENRDALTHDLDASQLPKALLYAKGKLLETAIIDALETLGFVAESYADGESEFDALFTSPEGRFLGEAEGKDTEAINIKKMQQLERNVQEDFARDEVSEYAKGVLFGNPCRLDKPEDRTKTFTDKVLSAARRTKSALVLTQDLFPIVQYLRKQKNAAYSKKIRKLFFETEGEIIKFPQIPKTKKSNKTDAGDGK